MIDYSASITSVANSYGVSPSLALAVAQTESSMNPNALGPVTSNGQRAVGLFQLMPATAAGLGVDPNDPLQNIEGGVKYLSQLLSQYGGDTELALAAYNAGPGNVSRYGGVPPFTATQNYVSKIMGMLGLSSDGGDYSIVDDSSSGGVDLGMVAILAGVGIAGYLLVG